MWLGSWLTFMYIRHVLSVCSSRQPWLESHLYFIDGAFFMLRIKLLRNLLLISLAIALVLPGYQIFYVHPAYHDQLTGETESSAVRLASYMLHTLGLEGQILSRDNLPAGLDESLRLAGSDQRLLKVRLFSPRGEIIYSSATNEVGSFTSSDYFHERIAKGEIYSKVVHKNNLTADGIVTGIDVVETYVPIMSGDLFGGAFELYYDITGSVARVNHLSYYSTIITLAMSLSFLLAIWFALYRVHISLQERQAAEHALQKANEDLEKRVAERTQELTEANVQLTSQVVERIQTETLLGNALEEIRLDREKLDGILRSVPDGVVVADNRLKILHMNAAAETILDKTLVDVFGRPVTSLSDNLVFSRKLEQSLELAQVPRPFDFELPHGKGLNPKVYQVRISKFVPDKSNSPGVVLLLRDVTMERDIERMKSAFLGMAAHELNTPLTTIVGFTELLTAPETADHFSDAQQKEFLHLIHDKALALGGLIDDLLDISRVESGRPLALNYQEFDLSLTIREVVAPYRERYSQHQFAINLGEGPAPLCADLSRLEQVLDHLVSNAVKYSPEGGTVQVSLAIRDGKYEFCIEDQGIGMNQEQLAHVFDRFYRANFSDTAVHGVGLGMSIVHHIVLAHHGDIQVESQPGRGTRVYVSLPAMPSSDDVETRSPFST